MYKNFIEYKDQHPVKAIVKGCKFLQESAEIQTSDDGEIEHNSMFEMVKQMVLHKGEVREMKSAMCHTTSNACKALNKSISDLVCIINHRHQFKIKGQIRPVCIFLLSTMRHIWLVY